MYDVFFDALLDTVKLIPQLLIVYVGIELIKYKFSEVIRDKIKTAGKAGPLIGAGFGIVPHGFSAFFTALYTQRLISIGTLLAVYISTSDEAVPVILAHPNKMELIFPLLAVKLIIAIAAGYSIDLIFRKSKEPAAENEVCAATTEDCGEVSGEADSHGRHRLILEEGCCGHTLAKPNSWQLLVHPIVHTGKVAAFIFAVSLVLNLLMFRVGTSISNIMMGHTIFQPVIAGLVGLIPNCAASVAITEVFLKGGISFGAVVAGLSSSTGMGMLVLFKENRSLSDTFKIIGLLYGISVVSGIVIQYLLK